MTAIEYRNVSLLAEDWNDLIGIPLSQYLVIEFFSKCKILCLLRSITTDELILLVGDQVSSSGSTSLPRYCELRLADSVKTVLRHLGVSAKQLLKEENLYQNKVSHNDRGCYAGNIQNIAA
jgi:hypothetical protein